MNAEIFLIAVVALFLALAGTGAWYWWKGRRRADASWESLLARLEPIDRQAVRAIALDLVDESGNPRRDASAEMLDSTQVWDMIGGLRGLESMERNCAVLIDMAAYVQRWHPEAVVVAENMRLNARELQFHLDRLKGAAGTGNLHAVFVDYAERAVVTYYRMTRTLLALYEQAQVPGLAALQQAL
jgi:hypothetical protein